MRRCKACRQILGVAEISTMLGLQPATITKYRSRGIFPEPDWSTARQDLWAMETIVAWQRNRQTREGSTQ